MDHILLLLKRHGITQVISNTHHLAGQITEHFKDIKEREGIDINFIYEKQLSGVAGGIRLCQDFLSKSTACIIMGDALTDMNLSDLYQKHREAADKHNCLVTIAQMQVEDTSQFGVIVTEELLSPGAGSSRVVQFQEKPSAAEALSNWANTGVYFFEPEVYNYIPNINDAPVYDVARDLFPKLLAAGVYMQAIPVSAYWADIGTPSQYIQSVQDIADGKVKLDCKAAIDSTAIIEDGVKLTGANEIGAGTIIKAGAQITNSVIWDNAEIGENSQIDSCIIGSGSKIPAGQKLKNQVIAKEVAYP